MTRPRRERAHQYDYEVRRALKSKDQSLRLWHYECADGEPFEAIAQTAERAWRVLNAERPGMTASIGPLEHIPVEARYQLPAALMG